MEKPGMVSLEDLMGLPPIEVDNTPIAEVLDKELNKPAAEVLPGLDPILDIVPPIIEENKEEEVEKVVDPILGEIADPREENEVEASTSILYKDTLKSVFGENLGSLVQEIDGVEQEIALEDLDMDSELFADILKSKLEEAREDASKNKISSEGISEFTKNLIELDKNGGDVRALLEVKQAYSDPLEGLDLEIVEDQKEILYLRGKAAGQSDKDINLLIEAYEAKGLLESEAIEAERALRTAIDGQMQRAIESAKEATKVKEENFKLYKKDLKENLNKFELKDGAKSKLLDIATKPNKDGKYEMDEAYNLWRMTPDKAAELAFFLTDKDEYIKQVTKSAVKEKQVEIARKIKIVPRTASGTVEPPRSKATDRSVNISDLK
jgi:hypothetical protein